MSVNINESVTTYQENEEQTMTYQNAHNRTEIQSDDVSVDDEKKHEMEDTELLENEQQVSLRKTGRYSKLIEEAAENLFSESGRDALDYLHKRGLTDETIKKFKLGYAENTIYFDEAKSVLPAILFAHNGGCSYCSARSLTDKYFAKPKGAERVLFNPAALSRESPCFIVEGQLDALSILQVGGNAVAIAGTSWEEILIPYLENHKPASVLILYLDDTSADERDRRPRGESQDDLATRLDEMKILYINAHFDLTKYPVGEPLEDANDLLQADHAQFAADVRQLESEARRCLKPDNVQDYIRKSLHADIMEIVRDSGRGTGFQNLDVKLGGLYNGLYFLGGLSAVGKTTFIWQMADQIAAQGYDVLFFSLEMSRLEMVTKSLSRYTAIRSPEGAVTSTQIRCGKRSKCIEEAAEKYMRDVGDRISVIEGNFDFDVTNIGTAIETYIKQNHVRPVVFIDYLQILPAAADPDTGRKTADIRQLTNENVLYLKRLSRQYQIPVIVTAALNRSNYLSPIDFESFRESSGIEYSADCVLGLQLTAIHDPIFDEEKKTIEKRERLRKARKEIPRHIELVVLKNRWGSSEATCYYDYYPQYDYYVIPENDMPDDKELQTFHSITAGEQEKLPFN